MIRHIIGFSIRNKLTVGILVLALIIGGLYAMTTVPVDAVPDITNNQVQVVTTSQSLAPQEVEQFITFPIEMAMANIPDVIEIRSISRFGLSVVTVVFEDDVPILKARQYVQEQLNTARSEIPETLGQPELMPITTGLGEIYQYTLSVAPEFRNKYDAMDLRTIQDWIVKRQLAGIKGIIEVSSFGGYLKQYEVAVNPLELRSLNVTIKEVYNALAANNQNSGGSYIEKGPHAYYIRTEGIVSDYSDIENIIIKHNGDVPVLIKDIAQVQDGSPPRYGAMTMDGLGETVGGITMMLKGTNSSEAIKNVQERVKEVQKSLPEGIIIEPYLDRSRLVSKTVGTVRNNLLEGGIVVILVLLLLLGDFRASLIVASIIPLSLLFAFIMMKLFGVSANLMSLGAIDFGIVIDGAVIIVEGVLHYLYANYLGKKMSQTEMDGVIKDRSSNIIGSAAFGVLIILVVFIPIMTLSGIEGKMFRPMAQTVSFAIFGALILSITYVPMIASLLLKKHIVDKKTLADRIIGQIQKIYKPTLEFALRKPALILISALLMLLGTGLLFNRMGAEFIPTLEEGDLAMQMTVRPGSSLQASIRSSTAAEKVLLDNFPEVEHVVSKIGTAEIPTDPMAVEDADIMIILKDKKDWVSAESREELVEKMKHELLAVPSASFEFTQPIQLRFNELMTGAKTDVAVKIFGEDMDELFHQATMAAAIIEKVDGAGDVKVEQTDGLPQMNIRFDRKRMARYGLNIEDLNQIIRAGYAGDVAGIVYEGERRFDLVVRLSNRSNFHLDHLYVNTISGAIIPLSEVASMEIEEGPMQITREDAKRRISVGVNIRNRDVASFIEEVQANLDQGLTLPPGYIIRYGGQFENLQTATAQLQFAVPISLLLIFILLFFAFGSIRDALIIYITVPLAAVGGVFSLYFRDMPFSISAGVGFIALFGVAVLNGIVLITYFKQLKKDSSMSTYDIIVQGGLLRLRPVIMTAAVASFGFLPMAISTTAGAEVQKPLATVVIGGLIAATFLTLVVLPVVYYLVEKRARIKVPKAAMLIILFAVSGSIQAQPYEQILDSALANNPQTQNSRLRIEQARSLKKSTFRLGPTEVQYAYGQMNTTVNDQAWQIQQFLGNPLEQINQSKAASSFISLQEKGLLLTEKELSKAVRSLWYRIIYERTISELYQRQLILVDEYLARARARKEAGELTVSELGIIEIQRSELNDDANQASIQVQESLRQLRSLAMMQTDIIVPQDSLRILEVNTTAATLDNTLLSFDSTQVQLQEVLTSSVKSGFFPTMKIGYLNQSIDGIPGLQTVQAGISLPLWFIPQRQAVQRAKIDVEIARNDYEFLKRQLSIKLDLAHEQYESYRLLYNDHGSNWLQQINLLKDHVNMELNSGSIDYFKFIQVYNQALTIELKRLELINKLNQSIIELEHLSE